MSATACDDSVEATSKAATAARKCIVSSPNRMPTLVSSEEPRVHPGSSRDGRNETMLQDLPGRGTPTGTRQMSDTSELIQKADELRRQADEEADATIRARLTRMADRYVH